MKEFYEKSPPDLTGSVNIEVLWNCVSEGHALSCRASPLPKQSTGLFWSVQLAVRLFTSLAERTMYEYFALCGERRGRRPRPARYPQDSVAFFYEKKLDQKTCLLSGFESLHRTLNFVLSEQTNNKIKTTR